MDFCGKPLVVWSIEQALNSSLDGVYVSTDSLEIANVAEKAGASIIYRPDELAMDYSQLEDVLKHAVRDILLQEKDYILLLQPTSPLRLENDIDNALTLFYPYLDSIISVAYEDDLFLWDGSTPVTFWRHPRRKYGTYCRENGSIYALKAELFLPEQGRLPSRYGSSVGFYYMKKWQHFEIDMPEDIEVCEYFMKKYIIGGN